MPLILLFALICLWGAYINYKNPSKLAVGMSRYYLLLTIYAIGLNCYHK